jgi:hypothetical protein
MQDLESDAADALVERNEYAQERRMMPRESTGAPG